MTDGALVVSTRNQIPSNTTSPQWCPPWRFIGNEPLRRPGLSSREPLDRTFADLDRDWKNEVTDSVVPSHTTFDIIRLQAEMHPQRKAILFLEDGSSKSPTREWTYKELLDDVTQLANAFRRHGVGRTTVVSILMPTLPEMQIAIWAAQAAGIANPVNAHLNTDQILHILESAGTHILVTQGPSNRDLWCKVTEILDRMPGIHDVITVDGDGPKTQPWKTFMKTAPRDSLEFEGPAPADIAAYFHTGGTTGLPKLARQTHANEAYDAIAISEALDWKSLNRMVLGIPLFHTAGAIYCSLGSFAAGLGVVMLGPTGFRNPRVIQDIWNIIEKYQVDFLPAVPTVLSSILEVPGRADQASLLKMTGVGSTSVPAALIERWREVTGLGEPITGWGLTEGTCQSTITAVDQPRKPGSVGRALPGCEVRVVDPIADLTTEIPSAIPLGEIGLILTRGPNVFPGYVDASHNAGVLLADGWLNTGDLGRQDVDGDLWVVGRVKDLIKRGGHGIDPANVEETLTGHADVLHAAVVGRPDAYAGEVPVAYVQLRPRASDFSPKAVADWCRDHTSDPAAAPVEVIVMDQLPLTTVGKISKLHLRWDASRRAIENEVAMALAGPTVEFSLDLIDDGKVFTGSVTVNHASQRSVALLRRRLEILPVPNRVVVNASNLARPIGEA